MYSTLPENGRASLRPMIAIEAKRFARHPLFLVGVLAAYLVQFLVNNGDLPYATDILAWPIVPAFFIGLPSLVVAAGLTRSTDVSAEAIGSVPGSEARRTLSVAGACVVPLLAGIGWLVEVFVLLAIKGPHPHEWWFGTMHDGEVWSILIALGPVACLGGALLGVLVGRWIRFRGAPAVAVVAVVALDLGLQFGVIEGLVQTPYSHGAIYRLFVPWAMFATGTFEDNADAQYGVVEGAAGILPGNAFFYLLYLLALCALAIGGAVWHDRTARTTRLRLTLYAVIAVGLLLLALAMFTGAQEWRFSEPLPFMIDG